MPNLTNEPVGELADAIENTLKHWRDDDLGASPLRHLYLTRSLIRQKGLSPYQAVKVILSDAIDYLETLHPEEADILRRRYINGESARAIGRHIGMGESTVFNGASYGRQLIQRHLQQLEEEVKSRYLTEFSQRLESPTYSTLVGMEKSIRELSQLLQSNEPPWIVSIEGMGGIGKTALADALVRWQIERGLLCDLAWVTARQSIFSPGLEAGQNVKPAITSEALLDAIYAQLMGPRPSTFLPKDVVAALTRLFKEQPYLIVIDNLETVLDVESLLPTVRGLTNPTRFLLTTRHSLYGQSDIYPLAQNELCKADALVLFRQEAHTHNLPVIQRASDEELQPIIHRTGGNPLAIKLVVGLLHIHSLDEIVVDLVSTRSIEVNRLYDHIYLRSWQRLSELEKNTLLAMPLIDELGGTLDDLAGISHIDRNDLHTAIEKLTRLNLVNRRGDLHASRYTIHSLTRSFIHRQLVEWTE